MSPRRPHRRAAARLPDHRRQRQHAVLRGRRTPTRRIYGVQFHPEVVHTPRGAEILAAFLFDVAGLVRRLDRRRRSRKRPSRASRPRSPADDHVDLRAVGRRRLVGRGDPLPPRARRSAHVHLRRQRPAPPRRGRAGRGARSASSFHAEPGRASTRASASSTRSRGVTDPEQKRKIIGRVFIEVFEEEAKKVEGRASWLVQGTLYPDVIESVSFKGPSAVIKSHHNVGGLPEQMKLELIEPLRELFKDEVRAAGADARDAARHAVAAPLPRTGPRGALPGRGHRDAPRGAARGRRHRRPRRSARPGSYDDDLAELRGAPAGADRGRHGRRAHLRRGRARCARCTRSTA